jgi:hypothetical protein
MPILDSIQEYIGELLVAIGSAAIAYFTGKKKGEAELRQAQGSALELTQTIYDGLVADVNERFQELKSELAHLKSVLTDVEKELEECRKSSGIYSKNV